MNRECYRGVFAVGLSPRKQSVQEFLTTANGDLLEPDFETTSRLAGRKPPMRSSCPASD